MQSILNSLKNPLRSLAARACVAMLSVLAMPVCAAAANTVAPPKPAVVVSQVSLLFDLQGGGCPSCGFNAGETPSGGGFGVSEYGDIAVSVPYGNVLDIYNGATGTVTAITALANEAGATFDSQRNLFVGTLYKHKLMKLPYVGGTWVTGNPDTDPACTGTDTVECYMPNVSTNYATMLDFKNTAFDAAGDLFMVSATDGTNGGNGIYELTAATLYSGLPVLAYADPSTNVIASLAVDPSGNLFFTDVVYSNQGNQTATSAYLDELPYSSTTGYAATPTVLGTETIASPGQYDDPMSGVAVDMNGTVYFSDGNQTFAIPNTSSLPASITNSYLVSTTGGRQLMPDGNGNLYSVASDGSNTGVFHIVFNNVVVPTAAAGTASTASNVAAALNDVDCTGTVSFAKAAGSTATASAATTGTCSTESLAGATGAAFATTVSLTPSAAVTTVARMVSTDSASNKGTFTITEGPFVGRQDIVTSQSALVFDVQGGGCPSCGFNAGETPNGGGFGVSKDGDIAVSMPYGNVLDVYSGGSVTTITALANEAGATFDAQKNLFVGTLYKHKLTKLPYVGGSWVTGNPDTDPACTGTDTVECFMPNLSTNYNTMADFKNTAFDSAGNLFMVTATNGSNGGNSIYELSAATLYTGPPVLVYTDPSTNVIASMAIDPWGNLFFTDVVYSNQGNQAATTAYLDELPYSASTGFAVTPNILVTYTVPNPGNYDDALNGVAVDANGTVYYSDSNLTFAIPNNPLTAPSLSNAYLVSPSGARQLMPDGNGNLYSVGNDGSKTGVFYTLLNNVVVPTATVGTASAVTNVNTALSAVDCTGSVSFAVTGGNATTASATAGSCSAESLAGASGVAFATTVSLTPSVGGVNTATLTATDSANNKGIVTVTGDGQALQATAQTITGFNPPAKLAKGDQVTLSATGGASGNPIVFSIDGASACASCATISGSTLTTTAAGTIVVDANQAGGTAGGVTYSAAPQVQATITITSLTPPGGPGTGILVSQLTWLGAYPTGGDENQGTAAGDSFGINSHGDILISTTYGGTVIMVNGQTGAVTTLGSYGQYGNTGGVAVDNKDNLYVGGLYGAGSNIIAKVPYVNGVYATLTDATQGTPPPNCTGSDTTECVVGPFTAIPGGFGVASMKFDAAGDMFLATSDQGNPHSIWECTVACLAGGTGAPAPVMLFQEPTGASPATTGQLYLGGIAVDASGNLFFTDSNEIAPANNSDQSSYSDLYELPYTAGKGYATTPTLLQTFTNANPGNYDDELDGVAVDPSGNVYYTVQWEGIFAFPNVSGTINTASGYAVSTQGGKGLSYDASGNLYVTSYSKAVNTSGAQTVARVSMNNVVEPVAQLGVLESVTNVTAMDNYLGCSTPATIVITSSDPQFSATAGASCSSETNSDATGTALHPFAGSNFPVTVNFTPAGAGPQSATLSLTDSTNGGTGTSAVTGTGQETAQTINFTAPSSPVIYSPALTIPLVATGGASGNPVVFTLDGASTGAGTITGNTLTVTGTGKFVIDANQAGGLVQGVYYAAANQVQQTVVVGPAAQAITFTAPASPVSYASGLTIALSATGGASANPVVFSVDSASTGSGTISGSTLTVTGAGTLVIDANQTGNTNYAAAPQVQQTIVVNQATQTITFTPPTPPIYFIVGGITINLVASGGASGNAVVFNVDPSSTGAGTIKGNVLTVTAQGNLVIDANQAGNSNYLAAAQAQETIAILPPLPTQTITFANPGTQVAGVPLTLTATATSGFAVSFASATTTVCTVASSSSTWTATFVAAGNCTIVASQPGDNKTFAAAPLVSQTFIVNPVGVIPSINLSFSLSSLTVAPGTVGVTQLTINSQNSFTGSISFACSGLPSGYSCVFTPNPVTVQVNEGTTTSLSIVPSTTASAVHHDSRPLFPAATLAIALCFLGLKKRGRLQLLLLLVVSAAGLGLLSACGGSSSSSSIKPTTSTVTVTATSGKVTQSSTFTFIVD